MESLLGSSDGDSCWRTVPAGQEKAGSSGADPGGGGGNKGGDKGAKNHTHRLFLIKIGQPRSKIQAKTYPKTH